MIYQISAACGCSIGKIRRNNEDNFYFNGSFLPEYNRGLDGIFSQKQALETELCFAVFDGMGGEEHGETASFMAASTCKAILQNPDRPMTGPRALLERICAEANAAVNARRRELLASEMGTTGAFVLLVPDEAYVCNIGDSRVYRMRDSELSQISVDDIERVPPGFHFKPGLTQFLGAPEEELAIEPHIVKCELQSGDTFLICSDGLTDMVSTLEISVSLREHISLRQIARHLLRVALKNGGRDNVTVVLIRVD